MTRRSIRWLAVLGAIAIGSMGAVSAQSPQARKSTTQPVAHPFAQALVDKTLAAHPETDEIGISVQSGRRCTVVASTDKSDVGETCEADDRAPISTGKPHVGKEAGEFDVSVPLHDKTDAAVGALTVRFKKAASQTNASVTDAARAIAKEMADQIASKAALVGR